MRHGAVQGLGGSWSGCRVEGGQQGQFWVRGATNWSRPRSVHPFTPHPRQQQRWVRDPHKAQSLGGLRTLGPVRPHSAPASVQQLGGSAPAPSSCGAILGAQCSPGGLRGCGWGTPPGSAGCQAAAPPRCSSPSWSGGSCRCCRSAGHLWGTGVSGTWGTPWGSPQRSRGGLGTHKCRVWSRSGSRPRAPCVHCNAGWGAPRSCRPPVAAPQPWFSGTPQSRCQRPQSGTATCRAEGRCCGSVGTLLWLSPTPCGTGPPLT